MSIHFWHLINETCIVCQLLRQELKSLRLINHEVTKENGGCRYCSTHSYPRHKIQICGQVRAQDTLLPTKQFEVPTGS